MSFDAAMDEVEVEDACRALGLDEEDTRYVLWAHRASDGEFMRACFEHGCDWQGYVQCRLSLRRGLSGD